MSGGMLLVTVALCLVWAPTSYANALRGPGSLGKTGEDVYYVTRMSDRFMAFMSKKQSLLQQFGTSEQERLGTAILNTLNPEDKALLEMSATVNEENRLEAQNAFSETMNFVTTLKQMMGAVGSAASCQDLTCGRHSYCAMDKTLGARCLCSAGYQGNGFACQTPSQFIVSPLLQTQAGGARPQMADLQVSTLQDGIVVAVYRDISNGHKGFAMLGRASPDQMQWHPPVLFSGQSKAFSPVLVQLMEGDGATLGGGGIAIAFRNANRGGDGLLVGGHVDTASGQMVLGTAKAFARHQAQAMAMVPLSGSRVAVIFAEHLAQGQPGQVLGTAMYGAALLAQVSSQGAPPQIIGKNRFAIGPVARFSVASLSPTSFGIAYRQDSAETGSKRAEAACIMGEARPGSIRFDSAAVLLEPDQAHIWARSLTLVGENTMSYTYHSGNEKITKQAILRADPKTHRLEVVHGPEVLAEGFSPVIGSVSIMQEDANSPSSLQDQQKSSLLMTVLGNDGPKPAEAHLCRILQSGIPTGCRKLAWGAQNLASVSGASVGDGRFVFVMTDSSGYPFYQLVGLGV